MQSRFRYGEKQIARRYRDRMVFEEFAQQTNKVTGWLQGIFN
jgi:hypothetical protein